MTNTNITTDFNPAATIGHNQDPTEAALQAINDLYDEVKNWADGEPISSVAQHDAMTELRAKLHEAGKVAEALRVDAKKPHDDAIAEIQNLYNPYVQKGRGKVDLGKATLDDLLAVWRQRVADEKAAEARRIAEEAAEAKRKADAAMQATAGNLAAREEAEEALKEAKALERTVRRADKAATTGTGLRTTWVAELVDEEAAMDWCWGRARDELLAVAQRNADEVVRAGLRAVPGFRVEERKVAR